MPSVRPISPTEHRDHLATLPSASFLQTPGWARVKSEWRSESLGWFDEGGVLVGAGLVLHRSLPYLSKVRLLDKTLAYLPEGPAIDWASDDLAGWLQPLAAHLKKGGAFAVRIGGPAVARSWTAATIKEAIADPSVTRLSDVTPDQLNAATTRAQHGAAFKAAAADPHQ